FRSRAAEPELVFELPVDGGGSRADTGYAAGADDFADRSRRGIVASTGRIADGEILGAIVAVVAVDCAAERCGGEIYVVVAGVYFAGYDTGGRAESCGQAAAGGERAAASVGGDGGYVERGNCGSGSASGFRQRRYCDRFD